jgi:hypothetical protein
VFAFYNPILLGCFDTASLVNDSFGMKEIFHVEFPPPLSLRRILILQLNWFSTKLANDSMLRLVSALVGRR